MIKFNRRETFMKNNRLILLIPLLIGISSLSACNTSNSSNENTHESKDDNNDLSVDENLILINL